MDQELKNQYPLTSGAWCIFLKFVWQPTKESSCTISGNQRWDWNRGAGVDSGRILRFSFGPGVKNLGKTGPEVTFPFW